MLPPSRTSFSEGVAILISNPKACFFIEAHVDMHTVATLAVDARTGAIFSCDCRRGEMKKVAILNLIEGASRSLYIYIYISGAYLAFF